jgi:peptide/nickel transport system permease protein
VRLIACLLLLLLTAAAGVVVLRSREGYASQDREQIQSGSSRQHWTGTDGLGRDRTTRVAVALVLGLAGAVAASTVASTLAVGAGIGAAFAPVWLGKAVMYLCDLFLTLPWIFLLMMVRAGLPLNLSPTRSAEVTFLLLGLLGAPVFVRVNYARAKVLRNADWLVYGRATGLRTAQLARRHVLPHLRPLFLTQFLVYVPVCIIAEANLGTLGLGISQPLPSWGSMLMELESSAALAGSPWVYLPIALLVVVLLLLELLVFEVEV